ncbi:hypothetical protein PC129_g10236 [Phytophthora cactorum]|uniref:Uncharacterized protein n=1 Tax=Phytophthora cactorum TaxID=29920 RepID=A0A329S910_9STRA|nr:hypothetical protein Pcac1_g1259 [Phytophthora cactorum]KAG2798961.1 hypothetical protein PC111_g20627 [Phytophthora cactorum]KAG2799006.1 hypothetical protein PC112_g21101 [Phytophthora cactorum]KAG2854321.1 hypothetical protein PC113_g13424 [Phytophthora cactorum]KAG2881407.1 hypothetical protein PC115_g22243 [Phytophthora cactorum]
MRREESEAVAAFLEDISVFLDDEADQRTSTSAVTPAHHLAHSVSNETLASHVTHVTIHNTVRQENEKQETTKGSLPEDAAEWKRALHNLKAGKRRDAYRKRLKAEWQTLRCEEVELATRLEDRRTRNQGGMAHSAWRAIAMRQLEGRRVAEAQQEKLKTAVKRRRELIQDAEDMIRKRLKEMDQVQGERSCLDKRIRPEYADERLFEAYLNELDAIYARTDAVFQSCETEPKMGPYLNTTPLKKRDGDIEYYENVGVLHVPFDFKRTCLALWEITRQPYRQLDREEFNGVEDAENTIAVRFRVKCRLHSGGVVSLFTHFVARRYYEEERAVIIWRELWEGEGEFLGMQSDETGWCIIQPRESRVDTIVSSSEGAEEFATTIKTCARLVSMHFSPNVSCHPDFDRFTEVLVTSGKEDNLQVEQMMERLQLGDALIEVGLGNPFASTTC